VDLQAFVTMRHNQVEPQRVAILFSVSQIKLILVLLPQPPLYWVFHILPQPLISIVQFSIFKAFACRKRYMPR
jgi:L-cystine uptake protein TcyP (sodium:dicarboxylate symporter family)